MEAQPIKVKYQAIIWKKNSNTIGERVSVFAESLSAAREILELKYGKGSVHDLHSSEAAERPR